MNIYIYLSIVEILVENSGFLHLDHLEQNSGFLHLDHLDLPVWGTILE